MNRKFKYGNIRRIRKNSKHRFWTDCQPTKPHIVRKTIGNMRKGKRKILNWYHDGTIYEEINDSNFLNYSPPFQIEGIHPILWKNDEKYLDIQPKLVIKNTYFAFILLNLWRDN